MPQLKRMFHQRHIFFQLSYRGLNFFCKIRPRTHRCTVFRMGHCDLSMAFAFATFASFASLASFAFASFVALSTVDIHRLMAPAQFFGHFVHHPALKGVEVRWKGVRLPQWQVLQLLAIQTPFRGEGIHPEKAVKLDGQHQLETLQMIVF